MSKQGVRVTLAALAIVIAGAAVAEYRLAQTEDALKELRSIVIAQDERMQQMELAVDRTGRTNTAVDKSLDQQSAKISELTKEINDLGRQVDRLAVKVR